MDIVIDSIYKVPRGMGKTEVMPLKTDIKCHCLCLTDLYTILWLRNDAYSMEFYKYSREQNMQ